MKVIIDTNAFMVPVQFGVDIFKELNRLGFDEFIVPSGVVRELTALKKLAKGKDKLAANTGMTLTSKCAEVMTEGTVDDAIIELAIEQEAAVLTNDIELKKRLCSKDITVVYLRGKDHLEMM
ncbi:MAG: DNA-binding protein [Methanosarcinales archaeon]|nr:DNA-binding protein [Methanosarcinales archaeon]